MNTLTLANLLQAVLHDRLGWECGKLGVPTPAIGTYQFKPPLWFHETPALDERTAVALTNYVDQWARDTAARVARLAQDRTHGN